jgi:hypothetical protein
MWLNLVVTCGIELLRTFCLGVLGTSIMIQISVLLSHVLSITIPMIELKNVLSQIYKASELIIKTSKNTNAIGLSFETSCH